MWSVISVSGAFSDRFEDFSPALYTNTKLTLGNWTILRIYNLGKLVCSFVGLEHEFLYIYYTHKCIFCS